MDFTEEELKSALENDQKQKQAAKLAEVVPIMGNKQEDPVTLSDDNFLELEDSTFNYCRVLCNKFLKMVNDHVDFALKSSKGGLDPEYIEFLLDFADKVDNISRSMCSPEEE